MSGDGILEAQRPLTDKDRCEEKLGAQQSDERQSCVLTGSVLHQQHAQCLRIDSRATVPHRATRVAAKRLN